MNTQQLAWQRIKNYETVAQGLLHVSRNPESWKGFAFRAMRILNHIPGGNSLARKMSHFPDLRSEMGQEDFALGDLKLRYPVGLPAGFFKEARDVPWELLGEKGLPVGFVTIGGISPSPQPGNPRPRHFSFPDMEAGINRYGLNSSGAQSASEALRKARDKGRVPEDLIVIGNINNQTTTTDDTEKAQELADTTFTIIDQVDAIEVNIACPNTASGTDLLRKKEVLTEALKRVKDQAKGKPIYLKISPDMDQETLRTIIEVSAEYVDGYSSTNTSANPDIRRTILENNGKADLIGTQPDAVTDHGSFTLLNGGISGTPLLERQIRTTTAVRRILGDMGLQKVIIGIGGIGDESSARRTILAGANAIALYSRLPQSGPGVLALANLGAASALKTK